MASLIRRAGVTAARSPIVQKRFGSHAAHHGPQAPPTNEGFSSKGFKVTLATVVGLIAWSRIDEHLTNQGEEKHPFTRYIEYYMRSEEESARINAKHMELAQQAAEETKLYAGAVAPPKVQIKYPDLIYTPSNRSLQPGTDVSLANVVPKYH
ncbi:hypothetical protein DFQ27_009115 [Actinomortierella ambigua]|uniref:Uncharacterized protein n=1 Tax=Actinomortierella ambigua TaxID=1343610 RepID=A0A9P6PP09_9FUNG|nr:hypothetical protein DFQ26_006538 [Actinomortierella ambigua]KAG0250978.1 hypothetical protein DFQ27_009115 [Actinomortierella ambigua]